MEVSGPSVALRVISSMPISVMLLCPRQSSPIWVQRGTTLARAFAPPSVSHLHVRQIALGPLFFLLEQGLELRVGASMTMMLTATMTMSVVVAMTMSDGVGVGLAEHFWCWCWCGGGRGNWILL